MRAPRGNQYSVVSTLFSTKEITQILFPLVCLIFPWISYDALYSYRHSFEIRETFNQVYLLIIYKAAITSNHRSTYFVDNFKLSLIIGGRED